MTHATADLYDAHGDSLRIMAPIFRDYGGHRAFSGPVVTLKAYEDNSLVRATLEEPGLARVLVVDGGGSLRCALVGDQLAELGVKNGWAGILIYGCVRDSAALANLPIGIKAMATNPRKSVKKGEGSRNAVLRFAEVVVYPADYLYADGDGVVVAERPLD